MKIAKIILALIGLSLSSCEFEEIEREIGYEGAAKANPWLALERFCEAYDWNVSQIPTWRAPNESDAMCIIPASLLNNETYVQAAERWTQRGGHMIILIDHAESYSNDWLLLSSSTAQITPALEKWLERIGLSIQHHARLPNKSAEPADLENGLKLAMDSPYSIDTPTKKSLKWVSMALGEGMITILSDASIFRNRWIGDHDHAEFLKNWLDATPKHGNLLIYRGGKLSLWELLRDEIGLVLIALVICFVVWLWINLKRFGPIDSSQEPETLRRFDQHLEATGHYLWRIDRAAEAMKSVRNQVLDRIPRSKQQEEHFTAKLAERCQLPENDVELAINDHAPRDSSEFIRKVATLQKINHSLNP
ncbi:MAG: hypothetical protein EAZ42_05340 [Verrucomicrobia bacterium]|nr:MAG: hypothetical protein EAZ42_05340 [Verrucomicrobiota bacterium]